MSPTPPAEPRTGDLRVLDLAPPSTDIEPRLTGFLLVIVFAALAVPVGLAAIPPLLDYPNHLVRLWLIAGGAEIEPLSRMYAVSWAGAYTNVGIDYLGALLGRVVPAVPLGSLLVLAALALPPLGAVALHRTIFGGVHWWQIGFVFFAWNATLIAGFLNFHIGIGAALLGAALEPRLALKGPAFRFCARLGLALVLLAVHFFALFYYCALLAGMALGPVLGDLTAWRTLAAHVRGIVAAVAPAALPALAFVVLAPALPGAHVDAAGNAPLWDFSLHNKLHVFLSPIVTYARAVDIALACAIAVPLAWALFAGRIKSHAGLLLAAAALAILGLAAPTALAGTWWIDNRFPLMAVLALIAGLRPNLKLALAGRLAMAGFVAGVVTLRTGWITSIWHDRQADIRALERVVEAVPAGSAVLPLDNIDDDLAPSAYPLGRYFHNGHPTHWSLSVLVIMWRHAFVPNLFWATGKQPLLVLSPWSEISFPEDGLLPAQALSDPNQTPAHFRTWRQRYDYVLLMNADVGRGADLTALPELRLVRDEGFARLYRIARGEPLR